MLSHALALALLAGSPADEPTLTVVDVPFPAGPETGMPDLAADADGSPIASWVERGAGGRVTLRLSFFEEGAWSKPVHVASGDDWFVNWVDVPRIAALSDGTLLATWEQSIGAQTYAYGVRFAVSRDRGASWTEPQWLHDDRSPVEHGFVSLTALDATRFVALWLDGRNAEDHGDGNRGAMALYSRTIEVAGGAATPGRELVVDRRVCDCCPTALAGSAEEGVICLYRDRSEEEVRDIGYAFLGEDTWTPTGSVHADGWRIEGCPVNGPEVASRDGRLAAVWFTGTGPGGGSVLVAVPGRAGFEAPVDVDDGSPVGRVGACFLADGSLLVSWLEHEERRATWRVRRITFDGATVALEPSVVVAQVDSSRASGVCRLLAAGKGAIAAWTADGPVPRVVTARIDSRARD